MGKRENREISNKAIAIARARTRAWASEAAVVMEKGGKGALIKNYIK